MYTWLTFDNRQHAHNGHSGSCIWTDKNDFVKWCGKVLISVSVCRPIYGTCYERSSSIIHLLCNFVLNIHRHLDLRPISYLNTMGQFYYHGLTLIPVWIRDYIHYKLQNQTTCTNNLSNLNGCIVGICELRPTLYWALDHLSMLVLEWNHTSKRGPENLKFIKYSMLNKIASNIIYIIVVKSPKLNKIATIQYYMNWLTHDFWTRTGGWEFDRSHGAGTSSPSHWQQV